MKESGFSLVQSCVQARGIKLLSCSRSPMGALQHPGPLSQKPFPGLFQDPHFQRLLICLAFPFPSSQLLWSFCCSAHRRKSLCKKNSSRGHFSAWHMNVLSFWLRWCGSLGEDAALSPPNSLKVLPSSNKGSFNTSPIKILSSRKAASSRLPLKCAVQQEQCPVTICEPSFPSPSLCFLPYLLIDVRDILAEAGIL